MSSIERDKIHAYLTRLFENIDCQDYAPNGLQIEGKTKIKTIASAVTASQFVLEQACQHAVDLLLVHHGYFWRGETPHITGMKKKRIATLLNNDMNLFAYHLPLDIHPSLGNNIQLAKHCDFLFHQHLDSPRNLVFSGTLKSNMNAAQLKQHLETCLKRTPLHLPGKSKNIQRIAWCTGAAQDEIHHAVTAGMDAFLTGEVSERTYHIVQETGIHFFAAGHHATERYGIDALGKHLAETFNLQHIFIDEENPI